VTIFQEILTIARIPAEFTINNFQIIGDAIVEVDEETAKVKDALNNLSDALLGKVLEKMTTNEIRALASLPPIDEPTNPAQ
jgi:chaperonin GroEL (HSP60 family)